MQLPPPSNTESTSTSGRTALLSQLRNCESGPSVVCTIPVGTLLVMRSGERQPPTAPMAHAAANLTTLRRQDRHVAHAWGADAGVSLNHGTGPRRAAINCRSSVLLSTDRAESAAAKFQSNSEPENAAPSSDVGARWGQKRRCMRGRLRGAPEAAGSRANIGAGGIQRLPKPSLERRG